MAKSSYRLNVHLYDISNVVRAGWGYKNLLRDFLYILHSEGTPGKQYIDSLKQYLTEIKVQ